MLLLGVIGGLAGSAFNHANQRLAAWRKERLGMRGARGRVVEALAVVLLTSTISFLLPLMVECQVGCGFRCGGVGFVCGLLLAALVG
jgi:chloride channel 7